MPTQKKKEKKMKEKNESKPTANIKQEPDELKPLAGYIDDRLELIRQVFSCVKPKEIKYLLPDFLEGKSNDVIKERCLDELLGISTKRLLSIINNTKCPTDTESDNSDVENIEEHISLDEISSDSDDDSKRTGKRNKKAGSKQPDERNGEAKSEKEMTVLELLELQARARAIRSQLALEPVTKIEIDSEHEEDGRHGDVDTDDETGQSTTQKRTKTSENGQPKQESNAQQQQQPRRVRLKRNFRIRQVGDEDDDEKEVSSNPPETVREKSIEKIVVEPVAVATKEAEPEAPEVEKEKSLEKEQPVEEVIVAEKPSTDSEPAPEDAENKEKEIEKKTSNEETPTAEEVPVNALSPKENADRESSPEVIPVEASPETLCISSDSEEERLARERASIFVPNIEELDRQAKEKPPPSPEKSAEDTEPEEGEISEDEPVVPPPEEVPAPTAIEQQTDPTETAASGDPGTTEKLMETDTAEVTDTDAACTVDAGKEDASTGGSSEDPDPKKNENMPAAQGDEIHNLSSGSEESDSESGSSSSSSSEEEEEEKAPATEGPPAKLDNSAQDDEDIVEIHDSGDENLLLAEERPPAEEEKSWNSRWLKSNRVAKVMAASRLGNKVREKLKKQKQKQQAEQQEAAAEAAETAQPSPKPAEPVAPELPANVELGSVEHYRELVAQQENKE